MARQRNGTADLQCHARAAKNLQQSCPLPNTPISALQPPLLCPDGVTVTPVCIGTTAGYTLEWLPVIRWRSYFTPLTDKEKIEDEQQRLKAAEAQQIRQQQHAAHSRQSAGSSLSRHRHTSHKVIRLRFSHCRRRLAAMQSDSAPLSRLGTVHQARRR